MTPRAELPLRQSYVSACASWPTLGTSDYLHRQNNNCSDFLKVNRNLNVPTPVHQVPPDAIARSSHSRPNGRLFHTARNPSYACTRIPHRSTRFHPFRHRCSNPFLALGRKPLLIVPRFSALSTQMLKFYSSSVTQSANSNPFPRIYSLCFYFHRGAAGA